LYYYCVLLKTEWYYYWLMCNEEKVKILNMKMTEIIINCEWFRQCEWRIITMMCVRPMKWQTWILLLLVNNYYYWMTMTNINNGNDYYY